MNKILRFGVLGYRNSEINILRKPGRSTRRHRKTANHRPLRADRVQIRNGLLKYLLNLRHSSLLDGGPG